MAAVSLDATAKTITAALSDQEFFVINLAVQAHGTQGIVALFAAYLLQQRQEQVELEKKTILDAVETLSDEKRGAVVALIQAP